MIPLWRKCCSYIRNHNHLFILEKPSYQNTFVESERDPGESESDSGESESVIHAWEVTTIFLSWRSHHLSTSSTKCVIPSTEYSIPISEWGNTFFLGEVINLILSICFWIHYNDFWTWTDIQKDGRFCSLMPPPLIWMSLCGIMQPGLLLLLKIKPFMASLSKIRPWLECLQLFILCWNAPILYI